MKLINFHPMLVEILSLYSEKSWQLLTKLNTVLLHDPAILFLSIYSTDSKINIYTDLLMNVYKSFICNHQNVPQQVDVWATLGQPHEGSFMSTINVLRSQAEIWVTLQSILLSGWICSRENNILSSSFILHSAKCRPSRTKNISTVPIGCHWGDGSMTRKHEGLIIH